VVAQGLLPHRPKIDAFLTGIAVHGNVAPATQNPFMNTLLSLDKRVLYHALPGTINAVRANQQINAPMVMARVRIRLPTGLFDLALQCQLVPHDAPGRRPGPLRWRPGGLLDDQLDAGEAQVAFSVLTVPYTLELRGVLAKHLLVPFWRGTSVRLARMLYRPARKETRPEDDTDSCFR
jgi:hypothetical protein